MKTIKEWYENMPLDIKIKALSYTKENSLELIRDNFSEALRTCFIFRDTKEGHNYWWEISNKY